ELLEEYAAFPARFPASTQVPYARDAADELRRAIEEAAEHSSASIAALSPEEQAREWIYRLREFHQPFSYWINGESYPMMPGRPKDDSEKTPVHRLIDLGDAAVPALLDALDDDAFTRTAVGRFNRTEPPRAMRVS